MPDRPYALVRRPAETLADGIVTFIERHPVDLDLAKKQWDGYVAALHRSGWSTVVIDGDDSMPDCVFVEDTVVMFGDLAVITNPRQPTRNPETLAVQGVLDDLGLETTTITEGNLDGGDVLKVGSQVYVGLSGTTDADAVEQLTRILAPRIHRHGGSLDQGAALEERHHGAPRRHRHRLRTRRGRSWTVPVLPRRSRGAGCPRGDPGR